MFGEKMERSPRILREERKSEKIDQGASERDATIENRFQLNFADFSPNVKMRIIFSMKSRNLAFLNLTYYILLPPKLQRRGLVFEW